MNQLEKAGVVGPQDGFKPRQVLVGDLDTLQQILEKLGVRKKNFGESQDILFKL